MNTEEFEQTPQQAHRKYRKRKKRKKRKRDPFRAVANDRQDKMAKILAIPELRLQGEELKKAARCKNTKAWMQTYARKFKECNRIREWDHKELVVPKDELTNFAIENFIVQVWQERRHKPAILNARRYLNYVLAQQQMPPLNNDNRYHYGENSLRTLPFWI